MFVTGWAAIAAVAAVACGGGASREARPESKGKADVTPAITKYVEVTLTTDLGVLTENERKMLPILIEGCAAMDDAFWMQAYGERDALLASIEDPALRRFAEINYGPWDRLKGDAPFLPGVGPKPTGARFYPADMTKEGFEAAAAESPERAAALRSEYTVIRRDAARTATPSTKHRRASTRCRPRTSTPTTWRSSSTIGSTPTSTSPAPTS